MGSPLLKAKNAQAARAEGIPLFVPVVEFCFILFQTGTILYSTDQPGTSPFNYTISHYASSASRRKYFAYISLIDGRFK